MPSRSFDLDKRCRELLCISPQAKNLEKERKPLWREGNKPTVLFGDRLRFVGLGLFISALHLGPSFLPRLVGIDRWRRWPRNNTRRKRNIYSAKRSYSILILGQTAAGRASLMWKNRINIRDHQWFCLFRIASCGRLSHFITPTLTMLCWRPTYSLRNLIPPRAKMYRKRKCWANLFRLWITALTLPSVSRLYSTIEHST